MKKSKSASRQAKLVESDRSLSRERIVYAAVAMFLEKGYSNVRMLDIATRARISNRDLYAEFESKHALLVHCIDFRAKRMKFPEMLPDVTDSRSLAAVLVTFGETLLRELTDPEVLLMYYLAVTESWRAPEVAKIVDDYGRKATEHTLSAFFDRAKTKRLLSECDGSEMANEYLALLLRNLILQLVMRVTSRPSPAYLRRQAVTATETFLKLRLAQ